jgi:DNA-binding NtrC family response regulator
MSEVPARGLRVLIVEDEPLVAMLLEDMLTDAGFGVSGCVSSIGQALQIVDERPGDFEFAILDVNLGGEPIFPVAEALHAAGKPFAFATGYGPAGLPEVWRNRPTLQKPFSAADVEQVLAATVAPG